MHGFETVQQELDAKRVLLEQELQSAQGKVAEIRADLERVHEALQALVGPKKAKSRSRSRKKPASTVQELQHHLAKVREEHPYASAHELKKAVRTLVRASGGSLAGFPRLFAEALVSSPGYSASAAKVSSHASDPYPAPAEQAAHSEPPARHEPLAHDIHGDEHEPKVHTEPSAEEQPAKQRDEDPISS